MSPEALLFLLRVLAALSLYVFLGFVGYQLWKDLRFAAGELQSAPRAHLVALDGPLPGAQFDLEPFTEIGRTASNNIRIDDETVSAQHARIFYQGGQWWVEDLASRNGTSVNDLKLQEPLVITYGDVIRMGKVNLQLERGSGAMPEAEPTMDAVDS